MSNHLEQVGARIRELRDIYGLTPAELAAELGISEELYLRYEQHGEDIPISVLYRLANRYGVDFTEILSGTSPHLNTFCVVPKGHGVKIDRYAEYHMQSLAYKFAGRVMEPMLVTLEPSSYEPSLVTHPGQEFNLVLEGQMLFLFDEKRILLSAGDSVYFDPTHPHGQMATGGPAVFVTVITEQS